MSSIAKLPGPRARAAAHSPATANISKAAAEATHVLVDGKFVELRVPYPMPRNRAIAASRSLWMLWVPQMNRTLASPRPQRARPS